MAEITAQEAQQVLQKLVTERRALERGLEIVGLLATAEQATQERQARLIELDNQIASKQQDVNSLDEHIAEQKESLNKACAVREYEADMKVAVAKAALHSLKIESGQELQAKRDALAQIQKSHEDLIITYQAQEAELSAQIAQMRDVLGDLKKRVAVVAGV
jgi:hypothetical protein